MICIPVTAKTQADALQQIESSILRADVLELRMDLISDGDLKKLINSCRSYKIPVKIIVTNRRKESSAVEEPSSEAQRISLLKEAIALGADYVDIETDTPGPLLKEVLSMVAAHGNRTSVIISHHDFKGTPSIESLKNIFHNCANFGGSIVKIVTFANSPEDNLTTLSLIPYARKKNQDIIAFCMGEQGRVSRIMAPILGSYLSFASLSRGGESAPGQLTVDDMNKVMSIATGSGGEDNKLSLSSEIQIFGLFGNPVKQSLSPLMHDTALAEMKINGRYLPFCIRDLAPAMSGIRGMGIQGVSITIPFKVTIMAHLDEIDRDAIDIGAVNTVVNNKGILKGFNTDWIGLVLALKEAIDIKGKVFAILGAGGTARATVFGIYREGGIPVIVNRNVGRGRHMAQEMGCTFYPLKDIGKVRADCLINTTPVGMVPEIDASPVSDTILGNYRCVMDVIYNPFKTKMLRDAEKAGCITVSGLDMFVHQGAEQIKLWTGLEPPRKLMKQVVRERLLYGN
ncbi:MAG TPA: shikimate dehydrogenase [Syntrophales bacterium]|nr:shikimate dehydrogenase [Syntrophales bacterium]